MIVVTKEGMLQRGMSEASAQDMIDMAAAQDQGIYDAQASAQRSNNLTSFRQWCEDVLKPAVLA